MDSKIERKNERRRSRRQELKNEDPIAFAQKRQDENKLARQKRVRTKDEILNEIQDKYFGEMKDTMPWKVRRRLMKCFEYNKKLF